MSVLFLTLIAVLSLGVAAAWRTPWRRAATLGAVAIWGSASWLWLTDAPRYAVYQHLRPWALMGQRPLAAAGVITQVILCVVLWPRWREELRITFFAHGTWRGLALVAILLAASAVPTWDPLASVVEVLTAVTAMATSFGALALTVDAVPAATSTRLAAWLASRISLASERQSRIRSWDRALPWACAGAAVLVGATLSALVLEGVPHIDDSVSYLFQAKYFSAGQLFLPAPPDSASFHVDQVVIEGGRWFAYGFPGWPALLAVGVKAGLPGLVNPLLGGATILAAHHLVRRTHDWGTANVCVMLLAASPWFLYMSGEMLSHQAAAFWLVLSLLGVVIERTRGDGIAAALAGLSLGLLYLTRPLDGAMASIAVGALALGVGGSGRLPVRALATGILATGVVGISGLAYNMAVTGDPLTTAHQLWMERAWGPGTDRLGFGADIGNRAWPNIDPLPGHGPLDVLLNLNKNLFQTNVDLFGWGFGSIALAVAFLLSPSHLRADRYVLIAALVFPLGYSLYWFSGGPDHGARYWYGGLIPLVVLTVRGLQEAAARGRGGLPIAGGVAALACAVTLAVFVPWRTTKYHRYRDISRAPAILADSLGVRGALVFVESSKRADYQSAFNLNPPTLESRDNIFARYLDSESAGRVIAIFPQRDVWVFSRDTLPGSRWMAVKWLAKR